jgi:chromosome segregation protein
VKLKEEYNLDFAEVSREDMVALSKGALRTGIDKLRQEILALGPVNTGSIQESERIGQRIAFLREQKEDLLAGQISLQKIITEIDHKMGQKFLKTFDHINKEFNEAFKRLFGGGAAYLELVDKEAPLESGIEIIAKPPGKKMQMISLLSGGERALTAISLLFALMLVKPAPFCVLDEIDTSLDDSNVERYCSYLKELDRKVQFVLVTHKKQTMKIADILYGVTMEEAGISKLISMKMREKAV